MRSSNYLPTILIGWILVSMVTLVSRSEAAPFPKFMSDQISPQSSRLYHLKFKSGSLIKQQVKNNEWGQSGHLVNIMGRVVGFGNRADNEWIVEAKGRRYTVYAGPRSWRNFSVSTGDQMVIEGEMEGRKLNAFWVWFVGGEVVNLRGQYGGPAIWMQE